MKKLVSFLLCAVITVSAFSTVAFASDEVLTSVFFASDAQFYPSFTRRGYGDDTINDCIPVVDTLVGLADKYNHDIETFVFGGDYTQNQSGLDANDTKNQEIFGVPTTPGNSSTFPWHYGNDPKYSIADIKSTVNKYYTTSDANILFGQGNHEPDITEENTYGLTPCGAYEFDEYIVYMINDQDLAGPRPRTEKDPASIALNSKGEETITPIADPEATVTKTVNDLKAYLDKMIANGDDRPVFIASHQPLYSERVKDYNCYAYLVADVVNEAAKKLDIVFFFGHTHQAVDKIGGGLSYVAKGDVLKVSNNTAITAETSSSYTLSDSDYEEYTLNFTYMNFGHLARYDGSANVNDDILSSTVIDITSDKLILTRYRARAEGMYTSDLGEIISIKEIPRINPKKAGTVIDGNGETKTLTDGEVYDIPKGTTYKNGTIDATLGKIILNGLTITGTVIFNENGKISAKRAKPVKIVDGTTNTFLVKDGFAGTPDHYSVKIKNNTTNNSEVIPFNFKPIYSGEIQFRLDITNVPSTADLTVVFDN